MAGALLLVVAGDAGAQTSVTTLSGLSFGSIISGTTTSVSPTSASAMSFRIRANVGLSLGFSLSLPTSLTHVDGGATMPVSFCSTCGRYRVNNSNPAGGATFNPANGVLGLLLLVASDVYVWVGGSTTPPLNQMAGSYTGTVVITLASII
ncbi:hypothetical protein [Gemmatimonas aurantiaca]|uniref:hypothetical protein n=1 Tax=Gemmatimonas aurantiaca TaxID=173480 RepID=UPI00301D1FAD